MSDNTIIANGDIISTNADGGIVGVETPTPPKNRTAKRASAKAARTGKAVRSPKAAVTLKSVIEAITASSGDTAKRMKVSVKGLDAHDTAIAEYHREYCRPVYSPGDIARVCAQDPKSVRRLMRAIGYGAGSGSRYQLSAIEFAAICRKVFANSARKREVRGQASGILTLDC